MSDDQRDDGFDLFDFDAPDESPDESAPDERAQPHQPAGSESGGRFSEFMAAMGRDDEGDEVSGVVEEIPGDEPEPVAELADELPEELPDAAPDEVPAEAMDAPESASGGRFGEFMAAMAEPEETVDAPASGESPGPADDLSMGSFEEFSLDEPQPEPEPADERSGTADEGDAEQIDEAEEVERPSSGRFGAFMAAMGGRSRGTEDEGPGTEAEDDGADPWSPDEWSDAGVTQSPTEATPSRYTQFQEAFGGVSDDPAAAEPGWADSDPEVPAASAESDSEGAASTSSYRDFVAAMGADDGGESPEAGDEGTDWESFTGEQYVQATTQEYSVLAEELARTAQEPTEQSAVSAEIPGLDSGVVGLDDVAGEHAGAQLNVRTAADVGLRVLTGVGLLIIFGASLISPIAIGALATVVFFLAAGEFSAVLIRNGYRPIVPLILAGTLACLVGAWVWGVIAIPVTITLTLIVGGLVFGIVSPERSSAVDAALTVVVVGWIGVLGAFVFPLLESDDYRWLITGVVVAIVAMDVGQFFIGRSFGNRQLAPVISPKKTVEGLIGGIISALVFSVAFAFLAPYDYETAVLLAVAAIVLGPLGDLSVSLVKRILGIKDMGTVLPGHGGILDRIDALLFMIPAAWVIFRLAGFLS